MKTFKEWLESNINNEDSYNALDDVSKDDWGPEHHDLIDKMKISADLLNMGMRIHMSNDPALKFKKVTQNNHGNKPEGLWYGFGTSWFQHLYGYGLGGLNTHLVQNQFHVYEINIKENSPRLLILDDILSANNRTDFISKYCVRQKEIFNSRLGFSSNKSSIDENEIYVPRWDLISRDYDCAELRNLSLRNNVDMKISWIRSWDISSGCVWGSGVIQSIEKLF